MKSGGIEVQSAMENRYQRRTVVDVPAFYITHYIECRFERGENLFTKQYTDSCQNNSKYDSVT